MAVKQQDKSRIVQIWGEILDDGFTSVPNILLRYRSNLGIKPHHLALIIDIMSFKWDTENPFPSYSILAQRAKVTERGIMKTIQDLERLNLMIRTQRFDEGTGVQITNIFDFRPLVQRLLDETKKAEDSLPIIKDNKGGEGELQFTLRVNSSSGGRVNSSSPKEYSYINKTHYAPLVQAEEYIKQGEKNSKSGVEDEQGVHRYFRNGIFRKRLFEIYDNLQDIKSIEELVEEASYKASKEILVNRENALQTKKIKISPEKIASQVKLEFPYRKMPKQKTRARKFFVASVCDLTAHKISGFLKDK